MAGAERESVLVESPRIDGIHRLAGSYQAFVVDVWGVICDGTQPFPLAVQALRELRSHAPVLLLSNTARRSTALGQFLERLGIDESCYDVIVTAGELCHNALRRRDWLAAPGAATDVWYLGPERYRSILACTGLAGLADTQDATALLCTGLDPALPDLAAHRRCLLFGVERGLPFLCANPDREVFIGSDRVPCAGALADIYKELGGLVVHFGKPESAAYRHCLEALRRFVPQIEAAQVLAIGDGMATDILGARRSGLASLLIDGGGDGSPRVNQIEPRDAVFADFIMTNLVWRSGPEDTRDRM